MKWIKYVFLLLLITLLTGCWNYRELSEISIVGAIGVDVVDDEFQVSVEIINAKKVANNNSTGGSNISEEAPFTVYYAKGKTIKEALTDMVFEAPLQLYIGHLNLLVIGEDAAKQGIKEFLDFFMADTESRKMFPTIVVKNGKAIDMLRTLMPLETVTSANIKDSLEAIEKVSGMVSNRKFDETVMCLYTEGREPTITSVEIIGDQELGEETKDLSYSSPKTSILLTGSAVFKDDKLVGYYNTHESLGYTVIKNQVKSMDLSFPCDKKNNYGNVTIDNVKTKLVVNLEKNKPVAEISVTGEASLPEFNCKFDISTSKGLTNVEKMVDKEFKKLLDTTINKTQKEFKSDVFGFGEKLYENKYSYWKKNRKNWDRIFPKMDYKIKTNIKIKSIAATIKAAKDVQ